MQKMRFIFVFRKVSGKAVSQQRDLYVGNEIQTESMRNFVTFFKAVSASFIPKIPLIIFSYISQIGIGPFSYME